MCKSLGDRLGEAEALEAIWKAHLATGQPAAALQAATDAVTVFQELGRRGGEAMACIMTASAQLACKATAAAVNAARGGVLLFHAVGDTLGEASALLSLVKALLQKASEGTFVQDGVGVHRWESSGSCLSFAFCHVTCSHGSPRDTSLLQRTMFSMQLFLTSHVRVQSRCSVE